MAEKTRVLVVDDDISFAESLTDILMAKGYDAVAVNSGEEALEKIKERSFDVVLMDIKMPVMDGIQTFKEIKKLASSTTVIMMTAYSMDDLIHDALKEGAYACIYKPFDPKKIVEMVEEIVKKKKKEV